MPLKGPSSFRRFRRRVPNAAELSPIIGGAQIRRPPLRLHRDRGAIAALAAEFDQVRAPRCGPPADAGVIYDPPAGNERPFGAGPTR